MRFLTTFLLPSLILCVAQGMLSAQIRPPADAEVIVCIGNGLGERMIDHPYFELELLQRFPNQRLTLRNLCRPGDTPGFRPHPSRRSQWAFPEAEKFHPQHAIHDGEGFHPTPDQWLATLKADTLIAFFGYNESFDGPAGLENFKGELAAFITHTASKKYNGKRPPQLILVSPIAFEDLSKTRSLPDGKLENENLKLYTHAMAEVAAAHKTPFIDLFTPTFQHYPKRELPFTRNGFLPSDDGYKALSSVLAKEIYGPVTNRKSTPDAAIIAALKDRNWHWMHDYRTFNGVHVDGRRHKPFGPDNYPAEQKKIREMVVNRDQLIWALIEGKSFDLKAADAATTALPPITSNFNPNSDGSAPQYTYGKDAEAALVTAEGYKVEMFASEKEFPNLANPMQLSFDNRGRLWVATMPTYPHYRPGDALPDDKLLIYEDTNGDGKADKETIFADHLHLPIGFEFAPGGVYVSQQPHLMFLPDADGDDKADSKEVVLTGFDSHDTHHSISAFTSDAAGGIMMCEGIFLHSNVETPYGPIRSIDGGFFRFSPQLTKLERTVQMGIPNPWGFAFDRWGQDFAIHTSGPDLNWLLPVSLKTNYGSKSPGTHSLIPEGQEIRPTSGLEIVSSSHFPAEVQGDLLIGNNIGFLGLKQHAITDDETGYKTAFRHDLLNSSDPNFRPADLEFAPDGSLYVIDWHNVLIGHMQHNARDPLRDHVHGRIYRITYPSRPLVQPAEISGAPIKKLLENLKLPEYRSRYRTLRELRGRPADEVLSALRQWLTELNPQDPDHEHHRLQALWVTWGGNQLDVSLLKSLLQSPDFHARAAAVRALRYHLHLAEAPSLLKTAASDSHGRVRLEAIVAASWLEGKFAGEIIAAASKMPGDHWTEAPLKAARQRLTGEAAPEERETGPTAPTHLTKQEQAQFLKGHEVYSRDAHCATCHMPHGKGMAPAFPALADSALIKGNKDRFIKIVLHGLMGPYEVKGKKHDGLVPMTPFKDLLTDSEAAAVMTYVRNSFGNKAPAITPAEVARVRKQTSGHSGFYTAEQLLREHPLEK